MNTVRKCSKCGRKTAGHIGKYGPQCTNIPLNEDEAEHSDTEPERSGASGGPVTMCSGDIYHTPNAAISTTTKTTAQGGQAGAPTTVTLAVTNPVPVPSPAVTVTSTGTSTSTSSAPLAVAGGASLQNYNQQSSAAPQQLGAGAQTVSAMITIPNVIPTASIASGVRPSYAAISNYAPTWSSTAPLQRPAVPFALQQAAPSLYDYSGMASQLAALQSQLNNLQRAQASAVASGNWLWPNQWQSQAAASPAQVAGLPAMVSSNAPIQQNQYMGMAPNLLPRPANLQIPPTVHGSSTGQAGNGYIASLIPIDQLGDVNQYATVEGLTDRAIRTALTGGYATLEDYLKSPTFTAEEMSEVMTVVDPHTGEMTFNCKRPQRKINSFGVWLEAYHNYQAMMVKAHGLTAFHAMNGYISYIQDADKKFMWPCVYALDTRHRQAISGIHINMSSVDPIMTVQELGPFAVKPVYLCMRCRTNNHTSADCPQSKVGAATQLPPTRNRSSSRGSKGKAANEICIRFNTRKEGCTFVGCKRLHVCLSCRGDLPFRECASRGPCAKQD